jgi:hypothetical protein
LSGISAGPCTYAGYILIPHNVNIITAYEEWMHIIFIVDITDIVQNAYYE